MRRKFAHSRRATTCTLGGLTPEVVQKGSERRFRSLCGRIRISLARSAAFWTGFWTFSTSRWGKVSLMQQIFHNRPAADKGIISVARHHLRVNTVSQARMYKLYSLPSDWQRVHVDMTVNSFFWPWITVRNCFQNSEHQQASWCRWRTRLKTGQFFDIGFLVSKRVIGHDLIQLEVVRMTMYEENSMDFCITTLG